MAGLWQIECRKPARFWRNYHFFARAYENDDTFFLECCWEQPVYVLSVYKNGSDLDNLIFARMLFADADLDKYVEQIMRIAGQDIERKLARVDQLHKDGMLGVSALCREIELQRRPQS